MNIEQPNCVIVSGSIETVDTLLHCSSAFFARPSDRRLEILPVDRLILDLIIFS